MANGHGGARPGAGSGGARPGAGRKKQSTVQAQEARRTLLLERVSDTDFLTIIDSIVGFAKAGSVDHIKQLFPYLLGAPPKQVELTGENGGPLRIIIDGDD